MHRRKEEMFSGELIETLTRLVEQAERKAKAELDLRDRMEAWVTTPVSAWEDFNREQSRRGAA